eukprot:362274-Chlamydomonas_euryale.AAC.1
MSQCTRIWTPRGSGCNLLLDHGALTATVEKNRAQQTRVPVLRLSWTCPFVITVAMGTEVKGKGVPESRELYGCVRVFAALCCACAWMVVSSMLTLVNKFIMVDIAFHHPLTVSTLGMFGSGALSYVCCKVFRIVPLESPGGVEFGFWIRKVGFACSLWIKLGIGIACACQHGRKLLVHTQPGQAAFIFLALEPSQARLP